MHPSSSSSRFRQKRTTRQNPSHKSQPTHTRIPSSIRCIHRITYLHRPRNFISEFRIPPLPPFPSSLSPSPPLPSANFPTREIRNEKNFSLPSPSISADSGREFVIARGVEPRPEWFARARTRRGKERDWKTETRRKTRVFVYFSRANAACVCSCARVYVYGLTFLSAEDRRASTRMAHRKSSTMRFARTAMRVARARAPISMILPPSSVRLCVPLFFFL